MLEKFKEFHAEEIADKDKYKAFAEELAKDYPQASRILKDIAHEECTHAKFFEQLIESI